MASLSTRGENLKYVSEGAKSSRASWIRVVDVAESINCETILSQEMSPSTMRSSGTVFSPQSRTCGVDLLPGIGKPHGRHRRRVVRLAAPSQRPVI